MPDPQEEEDFSFLPPEEGEEESLSPPTPKRTPRKTSKPSKGKLKKLKVLTEGMQIMQMRVEGHSIDDIARLMGIAPKKVAAIQAVALKRLTEDFRETRDEMIALETQRCEEITKNFAPLSKRGNVRAAEALLKAAQHKAQLHGLYAPTQIQQQVLLTQMTPDELREQAKRMGFDLGAQVAEKALPPADARLPGEEDGDVIEGEVISRD